MILVMPKELIVGPFPQIISKENKEKLLHHFGAVKLYHLNKKNKEIYIRAEFDSHEKCEIALRNMHQFEILGRRLIAKYYSPSSHRNLTSVEDNSSRSLACDTSLELISALLKYESELAGISSHLGVNFPINPKLRYVYPPANPNVLVNISHALVSVPKFYTQVLHLMNKMNLPSPFGPLTPEPLLCKEAKAHTRVLRPDERLVDAEESGQPADVDMNDVMSSESELETDEDNLNARSNETPRIVKRQFRRKVTSIKRPKLERLKQTLLSSNKEVNRSKQDAPDLKEVFEIPSQNNKKTLNVKVSQETRAQSLPTVNNTVEEGFGKMYPAAKELDEEIAQESSKYISLAELARNRVSEADWPVVPVFKNYSRGTLSPKLYIKNLAKTATEADLKFVLGRFIKEHESVDDADSFSVRLMKEGRMKGQAFVTFSNEESAELALRTTNGYILKDKPMVIAFGKVKAND